MTKKLEEVFNLPDVEENIIDIDIDNIDIDRLEKQHPEEKEYSIDDIETAIATADKVNDALAPVRGLEALDTDMDDYADRAMVAFDDLMELGANVEDRHAATIFDSASKMMTNALTAKTAKMDKKLKVIQMQLQKQKLELEQQKLKHAIAKDKMKNNDDPDDVQGAGEIIVDRNEIISAVMDQINNSNEKE